MRVAQRFSAGTQRCAMKPVPRGTKDGLCRPAGLVGFGLNYPASKRWAISILRWPPLAPREDR